MLGYSHDGSSVSSSLPPSIYSTPNLTPRLMLQPPQTSTAPLQRQQQGGGGSRDEDAAGLSSQPSPPTPEAVQAAGSNDTHPGARRVPPGEGGPVTSAMAATGEGVLMAASARLQQGARAEAPPALQPVDSVRGVKWHDDVMSPTPAKPGAGRRAVSSLALRLATKVIGSVQAQGNSWLHVLQPDQAAGQAVNQQSDRPAEQAAKQAAEQADKQTAEQPVGEVATGGLPAPSLIPETSLDPAPEPPLDSVPAAAPTPALAAPVVPSSAAVAADYDADGLLDDFDDALMAMWPGGMEQDEGGQVGTG